MVVYSLRIAALLALVFAASGVALMVALEHGGLRERLADPDALLAALALVLLVAWLLLQPLARRLAAAEDEAQRQAAAGAALAAQLQQADRQRQSLVLNLSHDLRTPLASMQGYLELLLLRHRTLAPEDLQNHLATAARQSERVSRLVADLFELARLETEGLQAQAEPFPAAELVHDLVQRYAPAAQRAGIELRAEAAAGTPQVLAELALVERLLSNLLDNALRHTPAGGRVTVAVQVVHEHARLVVSDTGEGIAGADLPGVFDRYATASRVGDSGSSGTGLGLAIARRIALLHGSGLELDSQPGEGTRVSFDLPLAPRRAGKATPAMEARAEMGRS